MQCHNNKHPAIALNVVIENTDPVQNPEKQNPERTKSRIGQNPEWTKSRIGQNPEWA